ncbi:MAG TPA: hypothetical protein VM511_10065, partial [Luteolibacter sp.]|nr:hypothetical protein [Luteolibacter sp.]
MDFVRTLLICFLAIGRISAEVMGFPIMLEQMVPNGVENPDCRKIAKPPEASPFFVEGDELWDLKQALAKARPDQP